MNGVKQAIIRISLVIDIRGRSEVFLRPAAFVHGLAVKLVERFFFESTRGASKKFDLYW